jgi:hypothetical protein
VIDDPTPQTRVIFLNAKNLSRGVSSADFNITVGLF